MALDRNKDISRFSAFKTPATTEYFYEFDHRDKIQELVAVLADIRSKRLPIVYIASGTNCLFAFDHFPGIIIHIGLKSAEFFTENNTLLLYAESGALLGPLVMESIKAYGVPTLLPWVGLPGTVGGAVVGNAGCFGLESAELVQSVEVLDTVTGIVSELSKDEMEYVYRSSTLK